MFAAILKSFRFDSIAFLFFASKNYVFWEATVVTKEIKIVFNLAIKGGKNEFSSNLGRELVTETTVFRRRTNCNQT